MNQKIKMKTKKEKRTYAINYEYHETPSYLWAVWLIAGEEIWLEKKVVATTNEDARFKAGVYEVLKEKGRNPSQSKIIAKVIVNLNED